MSGRWLRGRYLLCTLGRFAERMCSASLHQLSLPMPEESINRASSRAGRRPAGASFLGQSMSTTLFSKKSLLGLVYVGIAFGLLANSVYFAHSNEEWLRAASQLDAKVRSVSFDLGSTIPVAIVEATLENPTDIGGLELLLVIYQVFVNSTTQPFSVQGSSVVANVQVYYQERILSSSSLNITAAVRITTDTVAPLSKFLQQNNTTLRTFVGISLQLRSS